jgi:predicted metal-binding protein
MAEKNLRIFDTTKRVIVCTDCKAVVAEDNGGPVGRAIVRQGVESHINHPKTELTKNIKHRLQTWDVETNRVSEGVELHSDFKQ